MEEKTMEAEATLQERARAAILMYLSKKGCSVLDELAEDGAEYAVVEDPNGDIRFVQMCAQFSGPWNFATIGQEECAAFERVAMNWLAGEHDPVDRMIHFDRVTLFAVSPERAMIKHALNVVNKQA